MGLELSNSVICCTFLYLAVLSFQRFCALLHPPVPCCTLLFHPQIHPQKRKKDRGTSPAFNASIIRKEAIPPPFRAVYVLGVSSCSVSGRITVYEYCDLITSLSGTQNFSASIALISFESSTIAFFMRRPRLLFPHILRQLSNL